MGGKFLLGALAPARSFYRPLDASHAQPLVQAPCLSSVAQYGGSEGLLGFACLWRRGFYDLWILRENCGNRTDGCSLAQSIRPRVLDSASVQRILA